MTDDNSLSYMRARYYSAEIRRFVNQDVLLGDVADGQSLNRFAFVTGNPVSFVDPFGLATMIVIVDNNSSHDNFGHAALYIDNPLGKPIFYDPNGSYLGPNGEGRNGNSGYFASESADLQAYLDFAKDYAEQNIEKGYGEVLVFLTTPEEEKAIALRITGTAENGFEGLGDPSGGFCATYVYKSIEGIGPFKNVEIKPLIFDRIFPIQLSKILGSLPGVRRSHGYVTD